MDNRRSQKFFWKNNFKVNDHVLIPRPDTEVVVETILNIYKEKNRINFLEVGVGSGCLIRPGTEINRISAVKIHLILI